MKILGNIWWFFLQRSARPKTCLLVFLNHFTHYWGQFREANMHALNCERKLERHDRTCKENTKLHKKKIAAKPLTSLGREFHLLFVKIALSTCCFLNTSQKNKTSSSHKLHVSSMTAIKQRKSSNMLSDKQHQAAHRDDLSTFVL